jgi:dTDP-4-dehydrorhamnose 3,5-epimerase
MNLYPIGPFVNGPIVVTRTRHQDLRGSFEMAFEFEKIREQVPSLPQFQQVNILQGVKGSIRGFHWSEPGANHWKIVTVVAGAVRDVVLDMRDDSESLGAARYVDLDQGTKASLVIPPGFAHGMQTLSPNSSTIYATSVSYYKNQENSISPIESGFKDIWIEPMILSERDSKSKSFEGPTSIYKFELKES